MLIYGKSNLTSYPKKFNHISENVTASKRAIIHIQVYDMDWATGENVTITAYVKTIKDIDPFVTRLKQMSSIE